MGIKYFLLCIEMYCLLFIVLISNTERIKLQNINKSKERQEMYEVFLKKRHDPVFMQKFKELNTK